MMTPRFSLSSWPASSGLALLIALAHGTIASAQGHTADPYRPYNSVYDPYVYPSYPNSDGYFPNQNRLEGRSGPSQANQFQDFLDENRLGADPSGGMRSSGAGTPYYRAHRRFDPSNRPNNSDADRLFREKQGERDDRYFAARKKYQEVMNERNPQKRAHLIQEYAAAKRLAERDFQRDPGPSAPRQGPATDPRGSTNPPSARPLPSPGTPPSSPHVAPATTSPGVPPALPGVARPRSSPPVSRPGAVGSPRAARTPSEVLRESESLERSDRSPTPPPRPRLQPRPAP